MKKNQLIIFGVLAVLAIALIGFLFLNNSQKNTAKPIRIGIYPYPGYGTFYIAQEKGLFKKYGVNAEVEQLSLDATIPSFASGQIQMLVGTSDGMAILADAGIKSKQVFVTSKSNGADGMAAVNSIKSIQDLKGKKVYVALGFPDHFFFRNLQKQAGLKLNDVELVNMDAELAASSFISGKIDNAWTWEPYLSKTTERAGSHILVTTKDAPDLMADDNVAVLQDTIDNRREDVKNVMRAFFEAEKWWNENVNEGNAIVAKAFKITPEELAPTRNTVQFADLETNLEKFDASKPWNVMAQADAAAGIYFDDGVIKTKASGASVTDGSLLQELK